MSKYCPICGGTGIKLDGSPCECRVNDIVLYKDVNMIDLTEQYQGIRFHSGLIQNMPDFYKKYMKDLYDNIISLSLKHTSILLCSPAFTSKKVMAYSAIQELFSKGVSVFPIYDLLEIRKITIDNDLNRKKTYTVDEPEKILTVPYLFVIVPNFPANEVYQTLSVLIDRRTRRNNSTVLLYDGSLDTLKKTDYLHILDNISGDGSYGSLVCKNFYRKETETEDGQVQS